jgi:exosortase/archaeosortase family protein
MVNFLSPSNTAVSWAENADNLGSHLERNDKPIFGIGDMCNGVDLMFTYTSVIMLLPYSLKRKLIFTFGGITAIIIANIIRISSLYFIFIYYHKYFNFNHHYLFTILMDVLIFYGWLLFIEKKTAV